MLLRAAGLRQAILKKAFVGRLVPPRLPADRQNPEDEHAEVLLEWVRAETGA